ncbi:nickel ABC transporter, nickel/metallophore periplasmic binding protein [Desulfovibrio psychrotolerans]|uniref:Nickel ABC transporter, nickel/metallophore periplasmic binding protein n=2 Tax=Desulfovibrio psychrotolerans TaxID=415242 RepID=A0A7J0BQL4_9BACT|nr:nickel ABC transporter, nickel/metallophore periplasmic binding protein [Desulfovibrio psychrotolerans]
MVLALTWLVAASGAVAHATQAEADRELVFVNFRDIRNLNPHLYSGELFAQNLIFESLVRNVEGGVEPWLAESWDVSADGRVYTFSLRRDVTFSDGEPFNAHAAKMNFDAIIENTERHTWLEMIRLMDSVTAVDDYTLRIALKEPYFPMLTELAVTRPFRFISPKSMINGGTRDGVSSYAGTGPYVLADNKVDEVATFVRNERYWGDKPAIKTIRARVIPDNQARAMALKKGEIDVIYGTNLIDAETLAHFSQTPGFDVQLSKPLSTRNLVVNTTRPGVDEKNVRKALQHLTNREAISVGLFNGYESAADFLFAPNVPYCDVPLKPYDLDVEKAKALLDEAGWKLAAGKGVREKDGRQLILKIYYNSDSVTEKNISEFMQAEFRKAGVGLELFGEEEQAYRDRMKAGDFDIVHNISWGTPYDPQSFIGSMVRTVYGDYAAQLGLPQKKQIDQTVHDILVSVDEEKRREMFSWLLTTLHDEAVYIPLTYQRNRAVFTKDLKGVTFNPSQFEVPLEKMSF